MHRHACVVLVGMPGAGKSTVGVLLAKELGLAFVDTDLLIQVQQRKTLQQIMDDTSYQVLRQIEEQVILDHDFACTVVATGGSAVYGKRAMQKLATLGPVVYLSCGTAELALRIGNHEKRGIAKPAEQNFDEMFAERDALYRRYAKLQVETTGRQPSEVVDALLESLPKIGVSTEQSASPWLPRIKH